MSGREKTQPLGEGWPLSLTGSLHRNHTVHGTQYIVRSTQNIVHSNESVHIVS